MATVIGGGILVFCAVLFASSLKGRREEPKPVPVPVLPGELDEPVPSAREAFGSLLSVKKRLSAIGCTEEQVTALCEPIAKLLTKEVPAQ